VRWQDGACHEHVTRRKENSVTYTFVIFDVDGTLADSFP
jgi:hypothetical protein